MHEAEHEGSICISGKADQENLPSMYPYTPSVLRLGATCIYTPLCLALDYPYKKAEEILEVSPKGLVPGLKFPRFAAPPHGLNERTAILQYPEEYVIITIPIAPTALKEECNK
jgi:hypothetical protein